MENNTSLQQQLLEAGVHFGHLKKKWNPKMLPYIFAEKKGIHIIDLNKTVAHLQETAAALKQIAKSGKKIMFVATKKQAEVLTARREIVDYVKDQIDHSLEEWGYHLQDLQINDITFDQQVMESMSKVVASNNLKAAAENEGQALLITKTKSAEAEGNAIKISAQAEKEAAQLRGQGVALFRQEVAKGMSEAAEEMKQANLDTNVILFSMWTEAIKNFAEYGKGNVIFLDGSPEGMDKNLKQMMGLITSKNNESSKK